MKISRANFVLFCTISIIFITSKISFAERVFGEIININAKFKIAFSDLGSYYLAEGDVVKLLKNGQPVTYLKVIDATSSISKLGPIEDNSTYKTTIDFSEIAIGDNIEKIINDSALANTASHQSATSLEVTTTEKTIEEENPATAVAPVLVQQNDTQIKAEPALPASNLKSPAAQSPELTNNFDQYFKQYTDNYNDLTRTLNDLIEQKRNLQNQWAQLNQKVTEYSAEIQKLQSENVNLKNQLIEKSNQNDMNQCRAEQKEISRLKENVEILKDKLRNLVSMVERKLNDVP